MTLTQTFTIIAAIILLSCNHEEHTTVQQNTVTADSTRPKPEVHTPAVITDTISRFMVDDYPLTNNMFGRDTNAREMKSGKLRSLDKAWFCNDSLQQTLIVELYTDYHRMIIYHFYTKDIPPALIKQVELHTAEGEIAPETQKQKDFGGFIPQSANINSSYFTTAKGIRLGDKADKLVSMYGKPDHVTTANGITEYYWEFAGDILYNGNTPLHGKPLAKDSYGHQATMYFKNNKLVGLVLHNDIP